MVELTGGDLTVRSCDRYIVHETKTRWRVLETRCEFGEELAQTKDVPLHNGGLEVVPQRRP